MIQFFQSPSGNEFYIFTFDKNLDGIISSPSLRLNCWKFTKLICWISTRACPHLLSLRIVYFPISWSTTWLHICMHIPNAALLSWFTNVSGQWIYPLLRLADSWKVVRITVWREIYSLLEEIGINNCIRAQCFADNGSLNLCMCIVANSRKQEWALVRVHTKIISSFIFFNSIVSRSYHTNNEIFALFPLFSLEDVALSRIIQPFTPRTWSSEHPAWFLFCFLSSNW